MRNETYDERNDEGIKVRAMKHMMNAMMNVLKYAH